MKYWDASALLPIVVGESTSKVIYAVLNQDSSIVTWWGTPVECFSALNRLQREGFGEEECHKIKEKLDLLFLNVDFIVQRGKELIAIEAKSCSDPEKKWFDGLLALKDSVKLKRSILVYTGKRKYKHTSGVEVLPVHDFMIEIGRL